MGGGLRLYVEAAAQHKQRFGWVSPVAGWWSVIGLFWLLLLAALLLLFDRAFPLSPISLARSFCLSVCLSV